MTNPPTTTKRLPIAVAALAVPLIAIVALLGTRWAKGPSPSATTPDATSNQIVIQNFAFHPARLTVTKGTRIEVTNRDGATHTLTAKDGSFDTKRLQGGQSATITPTTAGAFPYYCEIHNYMTGTLVVR
jgi:plastocyanin